MTAKELGNNVKEKFTRAFWVANWVELLERAAWYGVFVALSLYLSRIIGFSDIEAGIIAGVFSGALYLLPLFTGAYADKIGFKQALLIAFALLTIGYAGFGLFPLLLESNGYVVYDDPIVFNGLENASIRYAIVPIMVFIVIGGSFIKSVITGTVAKETNEANRARGFSIFYMMVNIGAFSGKTIVKPLRNSMGDLGFINLNYFAAAMTLLAFFLIIFFYNSTKHEGEGKSMKEIWSALVKVVSNVRLLALIIIITGFWLVQHQLYATMPKYVLRMAGEGAAPSWYANVNPFVVVLFVAAITQWMRKKTPLYSMTVGMFIMPISALLMATGNLFDQSTEMMWMHPVAFMMVVGIVFQGLAECFISPRYLEFFSLQSPKGEEGLYLGFSHLHSFLAAVLGFISSGFLLDRYCPDPKSLAPGVTWEEASAQAHYIWYYFMVIALVAAIALIVYGRVTRKRDAAKELA